MSEATLKKTISLFGKYLLIVGLVILLGGFLVTIGSIQIPYLFSGNPGLDWLHMLTDLIFTALTFALPPVVGAVFTALGVVLHLVGKNLDSGN